MKKNDRTKCIFCAFSPYSEIDVSELRELEFPKAQELLFFFTILDENNYSELSSAFFFLKEKRRLFSPLRASSSFTLPSNSCLGRIFQLNTKPLDMVATNPFSVYP